MERGVDTRDGEKKRTLVIGASKNKSRYSHKAVLRLSNAGHPVVALGLQESHIEDTPIITGMPQLEYIHTITMYVGPARQKDYYKYLLSLSPHRIIFNPGTENPVFLKMAEKAGIKCIEKCTLVMLALGEF